MSNPEPGHIAQVVIAECIVDFATGRGWPPNHPVLQATVARATVAYSYGQSVGEVCDAAYRDLRDWELAHHH